MVEVPLILHLLVVLQQQNQPQPVYHVELFFLELELALLVFFLLDHLLVLNLGSLQILLEQLQVPQLLVVLFKLFICIVFLPF